MFTTLRRRLHDIRSDFVTVKYQLLGEEERTLSVGGVEAKFKVASHAERWRVDQCMGEREVVERFIGDIDGKTKLWDVGAAVGTYSILAAKRANHVIAFEPEPRNYRRLQENAELNSLNNIDIRNIALSNAEQTLGMERANGSVGGGAHRIEEDGDIEVTALQGDAVSAPDPDLIKIDVEGYELSVLEGVEERLRNCEVLYIEVHPEQGVSIATVREKLENHGFLVSELPQGERSELYLRAEKE